MAVLALRLADCRNGVSKLHGDGQPRACGSNVWPGVPADEVPIDHDHQRRPHAHAGCQPRHGRAVRPLPRARSWRERPGRPRASGSASTRSPTRSCGARTSGGASGWWRSPAARCASSSTPRGAPPAEIDAADEVLDPEALTIGFARRFATYKRATLILPRPRAAGRASSTTRSGRCRSSSPARPTRATTPGKELIRQIVHIASASRVPPAASSSSRTTT